MILLMLHQAGSRTFLGANRVSSVNGGTLWPQAPNLDFSTLHLYYQQISWLSFKFYPQYARLPPSLLTPQVQAASQCERRLWVGAPGALQELPKIPACHQAFLSFHIIGSYQLWPKETGIHRKLAQGRIAFERTRSSICRIGGNYF